MDCRRASDIAGIGAIQSFPAGVTDVQVERMSAPNSKEFVTATTLGPSLGPVALEVPHHTTGGATTKFRDVDFSFEPGLSGRWIDDRGVELGARLALDQDEDRHRRAADGGLSGHGEDRRPRPHLDHQRWPDLARSP